MTNDNIWLFETVALITSHHSFSCLFFIHLSLIFLPQNWHVLSSIVKKCWICVGFVLCCVVLCWICVVIRLQSFMYLFGEHFIFWSYASLVVVLLWIFYHIYYIYIPSLKNIFFIIENTRHFIVIYLTKNC